MNLINKKNKLLSFYKILIKECLDEFIFSKQKTEKELEAIIKLLSLDSNDFKKIENEILLDLSENKYQIQITPLDKIINIISSQNHNIKIDYKANDNDPALYYYKDNNLYLINYDSIDNLWYLSLIEDESLNLIEELFSGSYVDFIAYLKN